MKEEEMVQCCLNGLNGKTGVRKCIDRAVRMKHPIVIYVVKKALTQLTNHDVVPLLFRRGVTPYDVYRYLVSCLNTRQR